MASTTLLFDSAFAIASAFVFGYVGEINRRRTSNDEESQRALNMFSVWWFGLAALTFVGGVESAMGAFGILDIDVYVALIYLLLPILVAALWGLVYYLLYIYTGRSWLFWPVTYFHLALLVAFTYLVVYLGPRSVVASDWSVQLQYERTLSGPLTNLFVVSILGPALFGALGYGTLFFRAKDTTTRYRVGMVAGGFILWFGSAAVTSALHISDPASSSYIPWWPVASRVISLVSTLLVLLAYRPPRSLQERFGIRGVETRRSGPADSMRRVLPVAWRLNIRSVADQSG